MENNQNLIGIDARFYGEAGPGRYAKAIVEHLEKVDTTNKYIVFLRKKGFDSYNPKNSNFKKVLADYPWYSVSEQVFFLVTLLKHKLDLFYVPHFNIPVLYSGKLITAIPDIIMHEFSTAQATTRSKLTHWIKKIAYQFAVSKAVEKSEKVIVPSLATQDDFLKYYPKIPESKYVLAYEGIDPDAVACPEDTTSILSKYQVKKPFLLYVSSMYRHKNVETLLNAFEILVKECQFEGQLVLVGKKDYFSSQIQAEVTKRELADKVIMPGMQTYVSDCELAALRKEATLYVFPSLKEGFSLTPLEAQAVGLSAVISDIPCHTEIYGDSVTYFDPKDAKELARKVDLVVKDTSLREEMVKKGYENIKKYNWLDTAKSTLATFMQVLN